ACLAGVRSRYDGHSCPHRCLEAIARLGVVIPVCPEILGGMGIPRPRCRFLGGDGEEVLAGMARVIDLHGRDRTPLFLRGARETMRIVETVSPDLILFKEGSPSCGVRRVDVEGRKAEGRGVTTALLLRAGIPIISEDDSWP
ncbi:MAG: DUF523 domain-containing protein, partial [Deltaproteobacteria bacterium]